MNDGKSLKYGISLFVSLCLFALINYLHFSRRVACDDCFFSYGLPFTFYQLGGFQGGAGIVWLGLAADLVIVYAFGAAIARVWIFKENQLTSDRAD